MRTIYANHQDLSKGKKWSYLTADFASGVSSVTVGSITGFAINKILLIEEIGTERTEIIKTHSATAPTGSTVTFAANTVFQHLQGTKVYIVDWDQVEFSWSATVTGAKSVLDTIAIQPDDIETQYTDSAKTSGYYFYRFKDTIGGTFSDYSDPIPYEGYADDTLGNAISYAMTRNKLTGFTEFVTHDYLVQEAKNCLSMIHGELKHWHNLQNFNYIVGHTSRGIYRFPMPADAWQHSYKSILGFRIGDGSNLSYRDKREWDTRLTGVKHSNLAAAATAGDTQITLDSSYDFDDTNGTVLINGQEITYTTNTQSTGVLSGIPASGTGSITANLGDDSDVWQGDYEEGAPEIFTIIDGYIYFYPIIDAGNVDLNGYMDYWKEKPTVDSDNDVIDFGRYEMVMYWLTAAVRAMIKTDGIMPQDDPDYMMFKLILYKAVSQEIKTQGQKYKRTPLINKLLR